MYPKLHADQMTYRQKKSCSTFSTGQLSTFKPPSQHRCTVKTTRKLCFHRKWPLSSYLKSRCEQNVCVLLVAWHFPAKYRTAQCYHSLQLSACVHKYDGDRGHKTSRWSCKFLSHKFIQQLKFYFADKQLCNIALGYIWFFTVANTRVVLTVIK